MTGRKAHKDDKDAVVSEDLPTQETPADEQEVRGEGQTQAEAAGEAEDDSFGGGEKGEADTRYSPGAETINPAFVTRNQGDGEDGDH